jgi:hypothetical protein
MDCSRNSTARIAGAKILFGAVNTNGVPLSACIDCGWQHSMLHGPAWLSGCDEHSGRPEDSAERCIGQSFDWQQAQHGGIASSALVRSGIAPNSSAESARIAIALCRNWLFTPRTENNLYSS